MVLLARDIMDPTVVTVDAAADVRACARRLAERHKGYAIVQEGTEIVGIVTEWDFLSKVLAEGIDPTTVRVRAIATPTVRSCAPDTPAEDLIQTMATEGIRRIVVRDG
ncbi:Cystathionine beta-synthase, core domain protein, partial [mine drainage metagenome]